MEEVDAQLFSHLNKLECSFSDRENLSIHTLSSEECYEAVVRLLWTINPQLKSTISSHLLPPSPTERFRVATAVSNALKDVGLRDSLGFQTLIYGSGREFLNTFIELMKRLPMDTEVDAVEEISFHQDLLRRARAIASEDTLWVPEFCRLLKLKHDGRFWCPSEYESELFPFSSASLSLRDLLASFDANSDRRAIAAAILSSNSLSSADQISPPPSAESITAVRAKPVIAPKPGSKPAIAPKPSLEKEKERKKIEDAIALLVEAKAKIRAKRSKLTQLQSDRDSCLTSITAARTALETYDEKLMRILEDPEEAKAKIERFFDERDARIRSLEEKWQEVKGQKMAELRDLNERIAHNEYQSSIADKLMEKQEEMTMLQLTTAANEDLALRLQKRVDKIDNPDSINRDAYIKRIFEITANIKKQNEELLKVWKETEGVMKEVKWTGQAVARTFGLLEDTLYKTVERSPKDERLYKAFVRMHNQCQLIISTVENIGSKKRATEKLLDKVEIAQQSDVGSQLERMEEDLLAVQEENEKMLFVLREASEAEKE